MSFHEERSKERLNRFVRASRNESREKIICQFNCCVKSLINFILTSRTLVIKRRREGDRDSNRSISFLWFYFGLFKMCVFRGARERDFLLLFLLLALLNTCHEAILYCVEMAEIRFSDVKSRGRARETGKRRSIPSAAQRRAERNLTRL